MKWTVRMLGAAPAWTDQPAGRRGLFDRLHLAPAMIAVLAQLGGCASAAPEPASGVDGDDGEDGIGGVPPIVEETTAGDCPSPSTWYPDGDGDGVGANAGQVQGCTAPAGFAAVGGDCDDASTWRHPGHAELCDGLDNDCDPATPESCSNGCVPRQLASGLYLVCSAPLPWTSAQAVCEGQGMKLARLDAAAENGAVGQALPAGVDHWIGATDAAAEGAWRWTDGAQFWQGGGNGQAVGGLFASWDSGEPNADGDEDCADTTRAGVWQDDSCGDAQAFVCERY
jgi:hypothetical protein